MNAATIYRVRSRWLVWVAFGCTVAIHLTAIVLAENKPRPPLTDLGSSDPTVIGIDFPQSPQEQTVTSPDDAQPVAEMNEFFDENVTPHPIHPGKKLPVTPAVRSIRTGTTNPIPCRSVKALTLYAPRPVYPYKARRSGITGWGIVHLTVNSASGAVIDARIKQSTGNAILDNATVETLRRWRFKPGVAANVEVPITYTLTGVSY